MAVKIFTLLKKILFQINLELSTHFLSTLKTGVIAAENPALPSEE